MNIPRNITLVILDAVEGVLVRRSLSHVSQEVKEVTHPRRVNPNPTPPIVWVSNMVGVQTTGL
jgi:hypothetical protein